jgi:hypothetical protein
MILAMRGNLWATLALGGYKLLCNHYNQRLCLLKEVNLILKVTLLCLMPTTRQKNSHKTGCQPSVHTCRRSERNGRAMRVDILVSSSGRTLFAVFQTSDVVGTDYL